MRCYQVNHDQVCQPWDQQYPTVSLPAVKAASHPARVWAHDDIEVKNLSPSASLVSCLAWTAIDERPLCSAAPFGESAVRWVPIDS
jgi:hypothetical protein